jgi:hypothetical protein
MNDRIKFDKTEKLGFAPAIDHAVVNRRSVPSCRKSAFGVWRSHLQLYRLLIIFLVSVGLASTVAGPSVQSAAVGAKESAARAYRIKAAFLYNFAKFTEWPGSAFAAADSTLHLCVLNDSSFGEALRTIDGRSVSGHKIRVRHVDRGSAVKNCHLLFVGTSEAGDVRQILKSLGGAPVLTISDIADFATVGGVIRLKTAKNKIRFEINQAVAERLGLRLSSKLLRLAEIIQIQPDQERTGARQQ